MGSNARAARLTSARYIGCVDAPVGARRLPIEGEWVERRFRPLQPVLPTRPRWVRRESGARAGVLGCDAVEVAAKTRQVDAGSIPEHGESSVGADEPAAP